VKYRNADIEYSRCTQLKALQHKRAEDEKGRQCASESPDLVQGVAGFKSFSIRGTRLPSPGTLLHRCKSITIRDGCHGVVLIDKKATKTGKAERVVILTIAAESAEHQRAGFPGEHAWKGIGAMESYFKKLRQGFLKEEGCNGLIQRPDFNNYSKSFGLGENKDHGEMKGYRYCQHLREQKQTAESEIVPVSTTEGCCKHCHISMRDLGLIERAPKNRH
jgi:hypothetical protein